MGGLGTIGMPHVAFVGMMGCGKTTVGRTLLRLEEPRSGAELGWAPLQTGPVPKLELRGLSAQIQ